MMKRFYGNIKDKAIQIVLYALDEKMAEAYINRDENIVDISTVRDMSKKFIGYSQEEQNIVEQFTGIKDIVRAMLFIDVHLRLEYEVECDTITIFSMSPKEWREFHAFLDSRELW